MSVLLFLLVPVVVVAIGWGVLVFRQRNPTGASHSVEAFRREMEALSPDGDPQRRNR
ncbi:MAG: hypothetical protein ABIV94_06545 [Acidimicrobiales bacterium]